MASNNFLIASSGETGRGLGAGVSAAHYDDIKSVLKKHNPSVYTPPARIQPITPDSADGSNVDGSPPAIKIKPAILALFWAFGEKVFTG